MKNFLIGTLFFLSAILSITTAQTGEVLTGESMTTTGEVDIASGVDLGDLGAPMSGDVMTGEVEVDVVSAPEDTVSTPLLLVKDEELNEIIMQVLNIIPAEGFSVVLPLEHTTVQTDISGFVARTDVTHHFSNPYDIPIEVSYMFPMGAGGAVDYMEIRIDNRTIIGTIKESEEARRVYEEAKSQGRIATLLTQQRDNIFTQQVANILPGQDIYVTISYIEELTYDAGEYTYAFPMVVGPRYVGDTSITDADEITAPILPSTIYANEIDLVVNIEAGLDIKNISSPTHQIDVTEVSQMQKEVRFSGDEIPNKDFVFSYSLANDEPAIGAIYHKQEGEDQGYVAITLEPQVEATLDQVINKEIVFVLDTSGSMDGRPIEGVKQVMEYAIPKLNEGDTFNIYDFDDDVALLFENPVGPSDAIVEQSLAFIQALDAEGGTQIDNAFRKALDEGDGEEVQRIILILTDGDVGNEHEILELIANNLENNKIFVFGVDAASNRFLLDKIAEIGKGKAEYIFREDDMEEKVEEFYETFASPVLTDIQIDRSAMNVTDVYPTVIPDLYAGQPIQVIGKYEGSGPAQISITGKQGDGEYSEAYEVNFPEEESNDALRSLRGRKKVDDINKQTYFGDIDRTTQEEEITEVGLEYKLLTKYTSFVAIDDAVVNTGDLASVDNPIYNVDGKEMFDTNGSQDLGGILQPLFGGSNTTTTTTTTSTPPSSLTRKVVSVGTPPPPTFALPTQLPKTGAEIQTQITGGQMMIVFLCLTMMLGVKNIFGSLE